MEEAELLKKRLQAITNKRKIQEDIVSKRLEIDKEKLKLQQLKKKSARDLWLMNGTSAGAAQKEQKAQDVTQQTKALQSNIYRIEKEIEALEREELNISTSEGRILSRLKAIEKSTEDIIKWQCESRKKHQMFDEEERGDKYKEGKGAANEDFKPEPTHVYSGTPDSYKSLNTPLNIRKQLTVDQGTKTHQQKPALFAMEINVQKDLRTGESRILSTCTVPAQELQQRGIKVYDDGRKSVYALRAALDQSEANGVDELSPKEVEELLKQATEKRKKPQEQTEPLCLDEQNRHCSELYNTNMSEWPELQYSHSNVHYPYQDIHEPAHMFHHFSDQHEYYHNSNGESYEIYEEETSSDPEQFYDSRERDRGTQHVDVDSVVNHVPPLSYSEDPKLSVLNSLPSDKPVTMIFMGYQKAEEDAQSFEGSIQAELVIIGDGEEEASSGATPFQKTHGYSLHNRNANNTCTLRTSETSSAPASLNSQTV